MVTAHLSYQQEIVEHYFLGIPCLLFQTCEFQHQWYKTLLRLQQLNTETINVHPLQTHILRFYREKATWTKRGSQPLNCGQIRTQELMSDSRRLNICANNSYNVEKPVGEPEKCQTKPNMTLLLFITVHINAKSIFNHESLPQDSEKRL